MKKLSAEFFGTFWLVLGGCGSAVLAAGFPELGIGFAGVSLAFGLTVLTMAYAVGHVSGAHFNPAVTVGLAAAGRVSWGSVPGYIAAQVLVVRTPNDRHSAIAELTGENVVVDLAVHGGVDRGGSGLAATEVFL